MSDLSHLNLENARQAIEGRFQSLWSSTPIAFQDVPFKVQQGIDFIALNVIWTSSESVALQSNSPIRDWGLIMVEVLVNPNMGTKEVLELCGNVRAIINEKQFSGVTTYTASIRRLGVIGDFLKYIVECQFFYQG